METLDLAHGLIRFRRELIDMGFSPAERNRCLEEFKHWFSRSQDYDLAISRVLERQMIGANKHQSFKHYWDTNITQKDNNENQAIEVVRRVYANHPKQTEALKQAIIILVTGIGIPTPIALRAIHNVQQNNKTQKGIASWTNNQRDLIEADRVRAFVRNNLEQGQSEQNVYHYLVNLSIQQLGRPLTSNESDKIELVILDEKVKLADRQKTKK
jgi:hypothetical protein